MAMKRVVGVAALATTVGLSAMTQSPGMAYGAPPGPDTSSTAAPAPPTHDNQAPPSHDNQAPPSHDNQAPPSHDTEAPPSHDSQAPTTQTTEAPTTHGSESPDTRTPSSGTESTTSSGEQPTRSSGEQTPSSSEAKTSSSSGSETTSGGRRDEQRLAAPSTQPPHPPFVPRGAYMGGNAEVGGPADISVGFSIVGHGAPPPPRERGFGWNDGPPPGGPPPNWVGPPPQGGWDGPPPPGGWNRRWDGPPRDVAVAQVDFGPFAFNTFTVIPVFNWQFGGWGYWFFGLWVPLY